MLKRIGSDSLKKEIRIGDCESLKPFDIGLEFNAPVHGTWNIVHIGLQMPQAHQVYVCADNCMRGVVMTAAEMDEIERFHSVILYENDILNGSLENETIEGVSDLIEKMEERPEVIQLFTVCLHHFLGCDLDFVYATLSKRFPDICFIRCYMDPILQRTSYTPEQKLRNAMLEMIGPMDIKNNIYVLGCDVPLKKDSYIFKIAGLYGFNVKEIWDLKTFEEYKKIGDGALYITNYPTGIMGVSQMAQRLNRPYLYLPITANTDEIDININEYEKKLQSIIQESNNNKSNDANAENAENIENTENTYNETSGSNVNYDKECHRIKELADRKCSDVKAAIGDVKIVVDYTAVPRPLSLCMYLLDNGFNVEKVYLDGISGEEEEIFYEIKNKYPNLYLSSTIHVSDRTANRDRNEKILAIGQKAAWFNNTDYFVNIIEGGGNIGYEGIIHLLEELKEAFLNPKDMDSIVPKKGHGLCNCEVVSMQDLKIGDYYE